MTIDNAKDACKNSNPGFTCAVLCSGGCVCTLASIRAGFKMIWGTERCPEHQSHVTEQVKVMTYLLWICLMSYDLSYVLCLICLICLMYIFLYLISYVLYLMSYVLYVLCISSYDMSLMSYDSYLVSHVLCVLSCNYVSCVLRTWC